ncbi:hypothetical protein GOBAR_AA24300 [Gossypium barbadense]|uniref:Uncharacterized protein n=1 Tax=Gossypium barbadense TaxID=3634 RepID=A0A2P5WZ67_GOSBA|nr:hypothetical protein GOBAR_AA24300 [Gossypium barbadense]
MFMKPQQVSPSNLHSQPSELPSCSPLPADLSPVNAPIDSPVVPMTNSPTPTLNTLPENTPTPIDSLQKTPSPKQLRVYTRKRRHIPETVLQSDSCRELDLGPAAEMEEEISKMCADCHLPGTLCMWTDCTTCFESCASAATECGCLGGAGEAGLPLLFIMALIVLGLFTVIGIFYSVLVATMVGQRIWQRHYHILAKRMLTKEYVVEDVDGEMNGSDWSPPPLPPEHIQQLKTLGLL